MDNDALRHQMTDVMALVEEQLAEIATVREKQAKLTATGAAADDMVMVTVDAQGRLIETVIDESYLDDHEFEELAGHITEAAQSATQQSARLLAEMMAPISERRKAFPGLSEMVEGAPDLRDLMPQWLDPYSDAEPSQPEGDDAGGENALPTVRR